MSALEDARAAADAFSKPDGSLALIALADRMYSSLRALIAEHERLTADRDSWKVEYERSESARLVALRSVERLATPPTDDERESLAAVIREGDRRLPTGALDHGTWSRGIADAVVASDVWRNRRQGPPTDAQLCAARIAYASVYETGVRHKEALRAALEAARAEQ